MVEKWRSGGVYLDWVGSGVAPVAFTPGTAGTQDQLFVIILSGSGRHYKYIVWKPKLQHIVKFPELLPKTIWKIGKIHKLNQKGFSLLL